MVLLSSEEGKLVPAEKKFLAGFKSPFIVTVMTRRHISTGGRLALCLG